MEKTSTLLIASIGISILDKRLTTSSSLMDMIIAFCTFICWIIIFYSWICHSLLSTWKSWAESQMAENTSAGTMAHPKPCPGHINEKAQLLRGEVEVVMEKLGILYDHGGDEIQEKLSSDDIADLFDEKETKLEEAKEAFDVFDENSDGVIDGNELEKVICKLGFKGFSEEDCERMIAGFDRNGDGVIDFTEFVKLLENSFC